MLRVSEQHREGNYFIRRSLVWQMLLYSFCGVSRVFDSLPSEVALQESQSLWQEPLVICQGALEPTI